MDGTIGSSNAAIVDANGNSRVTQGQPTVATYTAGSGALAPTALMDLFCIEAPASGVIRIVKIVIWNPGTATAAALNALTLIRRTTAGTGGVVTPAPHDAADAAYGGIVRMGNTTVGTAGTIIDTYAIYTPATTLATFAPVIIDFGSEPAKMPVIPAGTANAISLKHPGVAGAANYYVSVTFTVGA